MYSPSPASISKAIALSLWMDTTEESISRESAARVAETWQQKGLSLPSGASAEWLDGWEMACETIALALRLKT